MERLVHDSSFNSYIDKVIFQKRKLIKQNGS